MDPDTNKRLSTGAWKLLETPSDLLVALRDRTGGLFADLTGLHPKGAVLAGDLSEMQPSDLLNFLHQGRRTGVLLARVRDTERALVFIEGNLAWAFSTSPGEKLGELLARSGLAKRERIDAVIREQLAAPEHRRIGQLLVDKGVIGPDELARGLKHQVVEIFLGLLVARDGSFVFLRGLDQDALPISLSLDTQAMLLDGLRRLDEMELFRTRFPSSDVVVTSTGKAPAAELSPEAQKILSLVDGARTLAELATASALGEFEATKLAFKLLEQGYLRL